MRLITDINTLVYLGMSIGTILIGVGIGVYKKIKKKKHKDPLHTLERDLLIQDILTELRVKINADRVYVCKFHNGGQYFDGINIKKISRTHESCGRGISHESVSFQNVAVSMVPDVMMIIQQSMKTNEPVVRHFSSLSTGFIKNHFSNLGVKIFIKHRITVGLKLVAYLGIQYTDEDKEVSNEDLALIKEAAGRIENIFAISG